MIHISLCAQTHTKYCCEHNCGFVHHVCIIAFLKVTFGSLRPPPSHERWEEVLACQTTWWTVLCVLLHHLFNSAQFDRSFHMGSIYSIAYMKKLWMTLSAVTYRFKKGIISMQAHHTLNIRTWTSYSTNKFTKPVELRIWRYQTVWGWDNGRWRHSRCKNVVAHLQIHQFIHMYMYMYL